MYGEIRKRREDGVEISIAYDTYTKCEGKNARGEKVFMYKCYPRVTGNVSPTLATTAKAANGTLMAPASMLRQLLNTK